MSKSSVLSGAVLAATLFLFAGCGGDDDDIGAICQKGYDSAASLKCSKAATCVSDCEAAANEAFKVAPNCKAQIIAHGNCAAARPASDWECDADGSPEPKDSVCTAEQSAVVMCFFGGGGGGAGGGN